MSYGGEDSGQVEGTDPETHRHTDSMVLHIQGVLRSGRYARTHTLHTYVWYYLLWSNHSMYLQYGVMLHTILQVLCTWVRWMVCVRASLTPRIPVLHICGVVYTRTRTYTRMCTCGYAVVVVLRSTSRGPRVAACAASMHATCGS